MTVTFSATTDEAAIEKRLGRLLVRGSLRDPMLQRRIDRVSRSFCSYAARYPLPFWAPGLVLDQEMRALTESLFPLREVRGAFRSLLRRGCRFTPLLETTPLYHATSWLDALQALHPRLGPADPTPALMLLAEDGEARRDFIFSLFLPRRYGASFERYPLQGEWLRGWLFREGERLSGRLRALDCACGSGEGTYRLAELVAECGLGPGGRVHGSTFEQVELFAAAHAYFPHDRERQSAYRERIAPLRERGPEVLFYLDDVATEGEGGYDVILCNGLLGGPMLWERDQVAQALKKLADRLAPGGVLLAADRFHAGWKRRLSSKAMAALLEGAGLQPVPVPEGVAARK